LYDHRLKLIELLLLLILLFIEKRLEMLGFSVDFLCFYLDRGKGEGQGSEG
jgi:hypothetical protein